VDLTIPWGCQPTRGTRTDDEIVWRVVAKADVSGVDYYARFDVPVFMTAESSEDVVDEEEIPTVVVSSLAGGDGLPGSKIRVRPWRGSGREFWFGPARNPVAASVTTLAAFGIGSVTTEFRQEICHPSDRIVHLFDEGKASKLSRGVPQTMLIEMQFPMRDRYEGASAGPQQLAQAGGRLVDGLRAELAGEFEIRESPVRMDFGGYWCKRIDVHRDGRLHATFSLEWSHEISADDFTLACQRIPPSGLDLPLRAAASVCVALVSVLWMPPLVGGLAGVATYLCLRNLRAAPAAHPDTAGLNDALIRSATVLDPMPTTA